MSRPIPGNADGAAIQYSSTLAGSMARGQMLDMQIADGVCLRFVDLPIANAGWIKVAQSGVNISCVLDGRFRSSFYNYGDADSVPSSLRVFSLRKPCSQIVSFDGPSRYVVVQLSIARDSVYTILDQWGAEADEYVSALEESCFSGGRFAVVNRRLTIQIRRIARALLKESRPSPRSRLRLYAHTLEMLDGALHQITLESKATLPDERDGWIEEAARLLVKNLSCPPPLDDLSHEFGVSSDTLQRAFRRRYGVTPSAFLVDQRMRKAIDLLDGSQASISQIGHEVGYTNPSAFTRVFTRHFGYPPSRHATTGGISLPAVIDSGR